MALLLGMGLCLPPSDFPGNPSPPSRPNSQPRWIGSRDASLPCRQAHRARTENGELLHLLWEDTSTPEDISPLPCTPCKHGRNRPLRQTDSSEQARSMLIAGKRCPCRT
jgi:hypothetical protein